MQKRFSRMFLLILVIVLLPLSACGKKAVETLPTSTAPVSSPLQEKATAWVMLLAGGEFNRAVQDFDTTMAGLMPAEKLQSTWDSLKPQAGEFQSILSTRMEKQGGYDIVFVTGKFSSMVLDVKVVYDSGGKIAGLYFLPSNVSTEYKPPVYSNTSLFTESEVTVGSGEWQLPGTLTMPKGDGPFPAVILLHGSGPCDRDETIGGSKVFKDLAWGLASHGIAVLRYEKRTRQYPEICSQDEGFTVEDETLNDAEAALGLLSNTAGIDPQRIFAAGHSLGGMMVPRLASREDRLAGIIILAGATRGLEDLILEQTKYILNLDGTLDDADNRQIQATEALVSQVKSLDIPGGQAVLGAYRAYWAYLQDYNPITEAAKLDLPVFVLQGERDYQVTMVDFANWSTALAGKNNVTLKSYPALNHLFISGSSPSTPGEYELSGNVAEIVVTDTADWIKKQ